MTSETPSWANLFWESVEKTERCWVWRGGMGRAGYGLFHIPDGRLRRPHRLAYELMRGPIPTGMVIDHLCRNRACVNPDHLEAVTNRENVLRGEGRTAVNAKKTHCRRGHPFDEKNTWIPPSGGGSTKGRYCRECFKINQRARYARLRAERALTPPASTAAEETTDGA